MKTLIKFLNSLKKCSLILSFLFLLLSPKIFSQSETCALATGTATADGTWRTANGVNIGTANELGNAGTCDAANTTELDTWWRFSTNATNTSYVIYVQGFPDLSNINNTTGDYRPAFEIRTDAACPGALVGTNCTVATNGGGMATIYVSGLSTSTFYKLRVWHNHNSAPILSDFRFKIAPARQWIGASSGGVWSTAANWEGGVVPSSTTEAYINAGTSAMTFTGTSGTVGGVFIDGTTGSVTWSTAGQTLTASTGFISFVDVSLGGLSLTIPQGYSYFSKTLTTGNENPSLNLTGTFPNYITFGGSAGTLALNGTGNVQVSGTSVNNTNLLFLSDMATSPITRSGTGFIRFTNRNSNLYFLPDSRTQTAPIAKTGVARSWILPTGCFGTSSTQIIQFPATSGTSGAYTVAASSTNVGLISRGMAISGTGIAPGARVVNASGTTITLSRANTGTVGTSTLTFSGIGLSQLSTKPTGPGTITGNTFCGQLTLPDDCPDIILTNSLGAGCLINLGSGNILLPGSGSSAVAGNYTGIVTNTTSGFIMTATTTAGTPAWNIGAARSLVTTDGASTPTATQRLTASPLGAISSIATAGRVLGFKMIDGCPPGLGLSTNYISRYYMTWDPNANNGPTPSVGTYNSAASTFTFLGTGTTTGCTSSISTDVIGTATGITVMIGNGTTYSQVGTNVTTSTTIPMAAGTQSTYPFGGVNSNIIAAFVDVPPGPTASVLSNGTGPSTICNGSSANLKVTITGGTPPYTVVFNDGTGNTTISSYTSGADFSVSPTSTKTYTLVSVTDAGSYTGSNNSGTPIITVENNTPPTGTTPQKFCIGATVSELTATGTSIQWYDSPSGGSLLTGSTTLNNGTIYYATQTNTCGQSSSRLAVTANTSSPVIFTVGAGDDFVSITAAAAWLNGRTVNCPLIFELQSDYSTSSETFPITFTNVNNSTNTITFRPATGVTATTSGDPGSGFTLIDFSGVDYFIFDGRQGGVGSSLNWTIRNTRTTSTVGPAIQMTALSSNGATNNTLQYLNIQSSNSTSTSGTVYLFCGASTSSNTNITIQNCDIGPNGSTYPLNGICAYANGTANVNNNISVLNNLIHDFVSYSTQTASGIIVTGTGTNTNYGQNWTISGNSLYRSVPNLLTDYLIVGINFIPSPNSGTSTGNTISNNTIGGSRSVIGGSDPSGTWFSTATGSNQSSFTGIVVSARDATVSGNDIGSFVCLGSYTTFTGFTGIGILESVGTIDLTNNIVGSTFGSGNRYLSSSTTSATMVTVVGNSFTITVGTGLSYVTGDTVVISNRGLNANYVFYMRGEISSYNSSTGSMTIVVRQSYGSGTASSWDVFPASSAVTPGQFFSTGIHAGYLGGTLGNIRTCNITGNTVANIYCLNATANARLGGIITANGGPVNISNNSVYNLSTQLIYSGSASLYQGLSGSICGISQQSIFSGVTHTVSGNSVYNLYHNYASTAANAIFGIELQGVQSAGITHIADRNLVYGLTTTNASTGAIHHGIFHRSGTYQISNNMIRLGIRSDATSITASAQINGIINGCSGTSSFTEKYYHNSVYIGGTGVVSGTVNTFSFRRNNTNISPKDIVDIRNNIFVNARSNTSGTGKHYGIGFDSNNNLNLSTEDFNLLLTSGTGGVLTLTNTTDGATLAAHRTNTANANFDLNSLNSDPNFVNSVSGTPDLHINTLISSPIESAGTASATTAADFDNQTRSSLSPVDIGADAANIPKPPTISFSTIPDNNSLTTSLSATITYPTGIYTADGVKPRLYYKKGLDVNIINDNTSGTQGWKFVEASNTTSPFTFTIDYTKLPSSGISSAGGVTTGDQIQYFVVAQNLDNWVGISSGTFSTLPSSVSLVTANLPSANSTNFYYILPSSGTITINSGTGLGNYTSLTNSTGSTTNQQGFFEAMNKLINNFSGTTLTGNLIVTITSDLSGELATNGLNQWSESGVGNYTLLIQPDGTVTRTISNSGNLANGLITINGADRITIDGRFSNAGRYLTFRNTNTTSSSTTSVIRFDNGVTTGNLYYLTIQSNGTSSTNGAVTIGSTGTNTGFIFDNNHIISASSGTVGSYQNGIYSNNSLNSNITITNNHFYFTQNPGSNQTIINLLSVGNTIDVTGNFIGGQAASAGGSAMNHSGTTFTGISVGTQVSTTTNITNNKVGNYMTTPLFSGTGSYIGVSFSGAGDATISENTIGHASNIGDVLTSIDGSHIGIRNSSTGNVNITSNTIGGFSCGLTTASNTRIFGIQTTAGVNNITGNYIRALQAQSPNQSGVGSAACVIGILSTSTSPGQTISTNEIRRLVQTINNSQVGLTGIAFTGPTSGTNLIERNFIHTFNLANTINTCLLSGIHIYGTNVVGTLRNNMVRLGLQTDASTNSTNIRIEGINDNSTGVNSILFNSVYIGGTGTGSSSVTTSAFRRESGTGTDSVYNNIFWNARSVTFSGSKNYAIQLASATGIRTDYNNVYVTGTNGIIGFDGTSDRTTLSAWRTANPTFDVNSKNSDPYFVAPTANLSGVDLHIQTNVPSVVEGGGTILSHIVTDLDYDGDIRANTTPTDLGADAINSTCITPTTQATNITFSNIGINSVDISWTNGSAPNRAVFIKLGTSGSATPTNLSTYTASTTFGSGTQIGTTGWYCVYNGSGSSVSGITGLTSATDYIVMVCEYGCIGGFENYLTSTSTLNPNTLITLPAQYYWVGGSSASDVNSSNVWSLTLGGTPISSHTPNSREIYIVDGSDISSSIGLQTGSVTFALGADRTMGRLVLQNNANLTIRGVSTTPRLITLGNITDEDLIVGSGSTLTLGSSSSSQTGGIQMSDGSLISNLGTISVISSSSGYGVLEFVDNSSLTGNNPSFGGNSSKLNYTGTLAKVAGNEWPSNMSGDVTITNTGGITINSSKTFNTSGGDLSLSTSSNTQILTVSSGATLTVDGTSKVTIGTNTYPEQFIGGDGSFVLGTSTNATMIGIFSADGITNSGSLGAIRTSSRTFSSYAYYQYSRQSSGVEQKLGGGLPTQLRAPGGIQVLGPSILTQSLILGSTISQEAVIVDFQTTGTPSPYLDLNGFDLTIRTSHLSFKNIGRMIGDPNSSLDLIVTNGSDNGIWFEAGSGVLLNLTIGASDNFSTSSDNLTIMNSLNINSGVLDLGTKTLTIQGSTLTKGAGGFLDSDAGLVIFENTTSTNVPSSFFLNDVISSLTMNGIGGITINSPVTVTGTLTLTFGVIDITSNNLTINNPVSGGSLTSYINTSGSGKVISPVSTLTFFPVGNSGNYMPVSFSSSVNQNYNVRVKSPSVALPTDLILSKVWEISSSTASTIDPQFTWNSTVNNGVSNPAIGLYRYTGSNWVNQNKAPQSTVSYSANYLNVNCCSEFSPSSPGGALPVELISFTAEPISPTTIRLNWITAVEIDNYGFDVERSTNSETWGKIGFVSGHNNSVVRQFYQLNDIDAEPFVVYYYRLKQLDNDGDFDYSQIVQAMTKTNGTILITNLYPNPITSKAMIEVIPTDNINLKVEVQNIIGQIVYKTSQSLQKEINNLITLDLDKLSSGTYFIVLKTPTEITKKKVTVVK